MVEALRIGTFEPRGAANKIKRDGDLARGREMPF
jgi:hypothetical protein